MTVESRLSELPRINEWIRRWVEQNELPTEIADRLDLCSTELVTNVIDHAYPDAAAHAIVLRLQLADDALMLDVEDDGRPFDLRQVSVPAPSARDDERIGGWGVALVRRFSDDVRYERRDDRNHVTLVYRQTRMNDARRSTRNAKG